MAILVQNTLRLSLGRSPSCSKEKDQVINTSSFLFLMGFLGFAPSFAYLYAVGQMGHKYKASSYKPTTLIYGSLNVLTYAHWGVRGCGDYLRVQLM